MHAKQAGASRDGWGPSRAVAVMLLAFAVGLASDGDEALMDVLSRNVLGGATDSAPRLARYARAAAQKIATSPMTDVHAGRLTFPDPEKFPTSVEARS